MEAIVTTVLTLSPISRRFHYKSGLRAFRVFVISAFALLSLLFMRSTSLADPPQSRTESGEHFRFRLGDSRFRHSDAICALIYATDEQELLSVGADGAVC